MLTFGEDVRSLVVDGERRAHLVERDQRGSRYHARLPHSPAQHLAHATSSVKRYQGPYRQEFSLCSQSYDDIEKE